MLVLGQDIALLGRGKAALRRQAELLQRRVFRGCLDPALEIVLALDLAEFRGHQPEHDLLLPLGQEAQRLEAASALGVVFEEIAVDVEVAQEMLGDELVAALGDEGRAEVAAAGMHRHDHVARAAGERCFGHARVFFRQPIGIIAARLGGFALLGVADHRPGGVIELQVAAAGVVEGADGLAVGLANVMEVGIEIRIDIFADARPTLAEMERRRRRDRHLRGDRSMVLDEAEVVEMRMAGEADLVDHPHTLSLGLDTCKLDALAGRVELDPVEPFVEVELPPGAPKLAVGGELQSDRLLFLDDRFDLAVFDLFQLCRGYLALLALGPRLLERRGTQEAADMVGAERRRGSLHAFPPIGPS